MPSNCNIFLQLWKFKGFKIFCGVLSLVIVLLGTSFYISTQIISSNNINYPEFEHLHFRIQYVYHGKDENFADSKYQHPYEKNQCTEKLTDEPIHFHDNINQIVHIHWKNITGGQVLKYYGLNKIGGMNDLLGYRWDKLSETYKLSPVSTYGNLLPLPNSQDQIYVFSGDKNDFTKRNTSDWLDQTLEEFFDSKSRLSTKLNPLGSINVNAAKPLIVSHVHNEVDTKIKSVMVENESKQELFQEELKEINNLVGNVVIFVQPNEPNNDEVAARFDNLQPLSPSTCGG